MLKIVDTFEFRQEQQFTSSAPMLFVCEAEGEFKPYFVKYILHINQFDCLVYEIICHELAKYFDILTPEIALVNVVEGTFDSKNIKKNSEFFRAGITAFGSLYFTKPHDMISKHETILDRSTFNQYDKPTDFIKIILFDLHIDNRDRHEENFNLLITKTQPYQIIAFDHFDCFCARRNIGKFNINIPFNINETIIRSTICLKAIEFLDYDIIKSTINDYICLCNPQTLSSIVDEVFSCLPSSWALSEGLKERVKDFITHTPRIESICEEVDNVVKQLKARSR